MSGQGWGDKEKLERGFARINADKKRIREQERTNHHFSSIREIRVHLR
jgi:hypothetical protein